MTLNKNVVQVTQINKKEDQLPTVNKTSYDVEELAITDNNWATMQATTGMPGLINC